MSDSRYIAIGFDDDHNEVSEMCHGRTRADAAFNLGRNSKEGMIHLKSITECPWSSEIVSDNLFGEYP